MSGKKVLNRENITMLCSEYNSNSFDSGKTQMPLGFGRRIASFLFLKTAFVETGLYKHWFPETDLMAIPFSK